MKRLVKLAGFALLCFVVLAVIYWLLTQFFTKMTNQPSHITVAIVTGIVALVTSQQHAKAREITELHRPKKTKLYTEFITEFVGILRNHREGKMQDTGVSKKLEDFFFNFTTGVMLWGSPDVLRHYGAFRRISVNPDPSNLLLVDDILQAMRKDLGLSNWGLARGDLIKMLLTDPESLDKK
jgi:predicted nucleic acid-binding protein